MLANPRLDLFDAQGVKVGANDNWKDWQKDAIAESALLIDLAPGKYTAIVSGVGGATGVGLVEANHLP